MLRLSEGLDLAVFTEQVSMSDFEEQIVEARSFLSMAGHVRSISARNRDMLPHASAQLDAVAVYLDGLAAEERGAFLEEETL